MCALHFLRMKRSSEERELQPPTQSCGIGTAPIILEGVTLETYFVPRDSLEEARVLVIVTDVERLGRLYVQYPEMSSEESAAFNTLREGLYYALPSTLFEDRREAVEHYMWETAEKAGILSTVQRAASKFSYYLMRDTFGFEKLDALIRDDDIEEVSCTGYGSPVRVRHRRYTQYGFMETNERFESEEELHAYVMKLAQIFGDNITRAKPYFEASILLDGVPVRAAATLASEMTLPGSTFAIRRQKEKPITMSQMTTMEKARPFPARIPNPVQGEIQKYAELPFHKTLTSLMAAYFWILLETTSNILVCGQTSSGKTTMLNAILSFINPTAKVVTVEDNPEIHLPPSLHWERMKTRVARGFTLGAEKFEIGLFDLLVRSLRFSPDYLIVGEVRGREAQTLGQAMMAGHSCLSSIHAGSAEQCIQRLLTPPMALSLGEVHQITSIVTMKKVTLPDGREVRRVESVDEVVPNRAQPEGCRLVNVFKYVPEHDGFRVNTPDQVLEASPRLREKAVFLGWSNEDLLRELERRASYLVDAVEEGKFSVEEFTTRVQRYRTKTYQAAVELSSAPATPVKAS